MESKQQQENATSSSQQRASSSSSSGEDKAKGAAAEAGSSSGASAADAAALSQRQEARRSYTVALLTRMQHSSSFVDQLELLEAADWSQLDVNCGDCNTLALHWRLFLMIQAAAKAEWSLSTRWVVTASGKHVIDTEDAKRCKKRFANLQPAIIAKLLEYKASASGSYSSAGELLRSWIVQLCPFSNTLVNFIEFLIYALHAVGFDTIDKKSPDESALLCTYAMEYSSVGRAAAGALQIVQLLLHLGAGSNVRGHSLMFALADAHRPTIILDVLQRKSPWLELGVQMDVWERDSQGRTMLQIATGGKNNWDWRWSWCPLAAAIRSTQQHWLELERPLQHQLMLEHTTLIPDLIHIVHEYVDGNDRRGQPLKAQSN